MNEFELKRRIVKTARDQFYSHGFTRVTVDQIATSLGISKKTVYKFFSSKDELVREVVDATVSEAETNCTQIINDESLGFQEKLQKMTTHAALHISKMGRPLIEDLERNAPEIWKEISDFRSRRIKADFKKLLDEGVKEGMVRTDIDQQLILLIYDSVIANVISPEVLMQVPFTASQVYDTIVKIFFDGILTEHSPDECLQKKTTESNY